MKFNPKTYLEKARIHRAIPGYPRVSRLYVWNEAKKIYENPFRGKSYFARKKSYDLDGNSNRAQQYFATLEEANHWLNQSYEETKNSELVFAEVVAKWRKKKLPMLAMNTQIHYEKIIKLYFQGLMNVPMVSFTAKVVDRWIELLKDPSGKAMKSSRRICFDHELSLLSGILTYYREYENNEFNSPILRRHNDDVKTGRKRQKKPKDIRPEEFFLFRERLRELKYGDVMAALATVQYFQGLRVSEVAAIHWEDVKLEKLPEESRLSITRSIIWPRTKDIPSYIQIGFKNAEANDGVKEQPLFPESYYTFKGMIDPNKIGLVFHLNGMHLEYRQIQHAYDKAFALAGLPYTATHIMRHGGTRLVYNATKDLDVAKQLLGNKDMQTVAIYAQRDASALTTFAKKQWTDYANVVAIGCK